MLLDMWREWLHLISLPTVDAVAAVPEHRLRAAWRGIHLPHVLARAASDFTGAPTVNVLARHGWRRQRGRSRDDRHTLVQQQYHLDQPKHQFPGTRILLIDDIRTTGATLAACASLLEGAGAQVVSIAASQR